MVVYNGFQHSRVFTFEQSCVTNSEKSFTKPWILASTHKHRISIQYPSHKCLTEKLCLYCLRILIMSWLFKDPAVIMKEIMSWLFKDQINSGLAQFDHAQSNSKKRPKGQKDQIVPNDLFSRKTTNKISRTY